MPEYSLGSITVIGNSSKIGGKRKKWRERHWERVCEKDSAFFIRREKKRSKSEMEMEEVRNNTHTQHTKTKTRVQLPFYSNDTTCFFFIIELKASLFNLLNLLDCGEQISTFLPSTCRVSSWRQAALPKGKKSKSHLNFTKKKFVSENKDKKWNHVTPTEEKKAKRH